MNVLDEIKIYCKQKNTVGALLLTGKWGCGKTFFINDTLEQDKEFQNDFIVIRVSLFGETNVQAIDAKIKKEYLLRRFPTKHRRSRVTKLYKLFNFSTKAIAKVIPLFDAINTTLNVGWLEFVQIKRFDNREIILVFDDLERCDMSLQEILGCLNEYVENQNLKTIIIGDEDKINRKSIDDGSEKKEQMTYSELKEKIFSRTIRLKPNHSSIVQNIILNYSEHELGYKKYLEEFEQSIIRVFKQSESDNIRSLKCAIQDAERLYKHLNNYKFNSQDLMQFMENFLILVFEYKLGQVTEGEYSYKFKNTQLGFKYVDYKEYYILDPLKKWVMTGEWDQISLNKKINQKYKALNNNDAKDILLHSFLWDVDDNVLEEGFPQILKDAYVGDLIFDDFIALIRIIYLARANEIVLPMEVDYNRILSGINMRVEKITNRQIQEPNGRVEAGHELVTKLCEEEQKVIDEIEKYRKIHEYYENKRKIFGFIAADNYDEILSCIEEQHYLDTELVEEIFGYYDKLDHNFQRRTLVMSLKKAWHPYQELTRTQINESIKGLELFKKKLINNPSKGQITGVIDKVLIDVIDKAIKNYNLFLNAYSGEEYNPSLIISEENSN